ncbi:IS240-type transposase [Halanaeroarchaeum sulfurireducens]|uniref:IS240-type transposase n=1 Tax=Halanaeroarchaeum sulfurireducens TaxID=1604004 RepID=A0A0F7PA36_9EURY|nr:IS240-type transposase [Halanaeroarchaeum sulfurireducens]ALG82400.1 IS240-type transposase [Halanaeroarchaeum sulfurireducens]
MPEISRLNGSNDAIELDFVERKATPKEMMELAIHLHLGGLSLSNTVHFLNIFGISRARSTVHNWSQKANLEPRGGRDPEKSRSMRRSSRPT